MPTKLLLEVSKYVNMLHATFAIEIGKTKLLCKDEKSVIQWAWFKKTWVKSILYNVALGYKKPQKTINTKAFAT